MKVITRGVIDWASLELEEEDSFEYEGPVALAKDSGSAPQPVDPYTQAQAQYGLSTGTALFNAGLNRTNSINPLGNSTWNASYNPSFSGGGPSPISGAPTMPGNYGLGGQTINIGGLGSITLPNIPTSQAPQDPAGGAPTYTNTTSLQPWANNLLQSPIQTQGLPGVDPNVNIQGDLANTQNAVYNQTMDYLQPEFDLQNSQLQSQLANQGALPGSAAYNNEMDRLSREQGFQQNQAASNAITAGQQEQSRLFGLGGQELQNQIALRQAPINEYTSLTGGSAVPANASTPDISGAFNQQYQGQLAGYNANVASNNATTSDISSLIGAAIMFSDKRMKTDIKKVGELPSGTGIYNYRFKGSPVRQTGVIAQDVEKRQPEAVFNLGGRKAVNYGALK